MQSRLKNFDNDLEKVIRNHNKSAMIKEIPILIAFEHPPEGKDLSIETRILFRTISSQSVVVKETRIEYILLDQLKRL